MSNPDITKFVIGETVSEAKTQLLHAGLIWERVRVINPNMAVTSDFWPKRLNLVLDDNDIVTDCYFG